MAEVQSLYRDAYGEPKTKETQLRDILIISLEDHARSIELAISSPFIPTHIKEILRAGFEDSFFSELNSIYPSRDWQSRSVAWQNTEVPQMPAMRERAPSDALTIDTQHTEQAAHKPRGRRASIKKRLSFLSLGSKDKSNGVDGGTRSHSRASSRTRF